MLYVLLLAYESHEEHYVFMDASCAGDQNIKIVRCSTDQFCIFLQEGYIMYFEAQILSRRVFFFTVSAKVLNKVVERVGSGQNKNLLWECDHWTKVRLRRDKLILPPEARKFLEFGFII